MLVLVPATQGRRFSVLPLFRRSPAKILQCVLVSRVGLRCSAWLWLHISIMWLAGNSAGLPCTQDAWNMDHSSSEAVLQHGFGRSVVSLCLLVLMRSRRAAMLRASQREGPPMEREDWGLAEK